jgi:multiple sugar transport system substrate-binding protein
MNMIIKRRKTLLAVPIALALVLAACSGGGSSTDAGGGSGSSSSDGGSSSSAEQGMGPGPGVKEASFPKNGLVDYTKQPYTPEAYTSAAKVNDGDRDCSYYETSKKDYSGQQITVMAPPPPNMGEPMAQHGAMFEELTGGKVIVENVSVGELYSKAQTVFQTGFSPYDVTINFSTWIGDFQQYYYSIPEKYTSGNGELADMLPLYKEIYKWNGETKLFGIDADRHFLKYRTDVLGNAEAQAYFQQQTGQKLEVPKTWKDYNLIAKTLHNYKGIASQPAGVDLAGSVEIMKRDDLMWSGFINRVAPYAKNPNVKTGFWFDENMKPQVNNPGFVRGLTEFVEATKFTPQGGLNFGLSDEISAFGAGQGIFSYTWDDAWSQANQEDSPIRGNTEAAPNPGAETVWNSNTNQWDTPAGGINYAPYIAWGWSSAIPQGSENKQMALDFLCFFANEANHAIDLTIGRTGVNPAREGDFKKEFWVQGLGWLDGPTQSWIDTLNTYSAASNRVFDLRVPGNGPFMAALADGVALALAGQKDPQTALDEVAVKWEQILADIGVDVVKEAYQNVIALENS